MAEEFNPTKQDLFMIEGRILEIKVRRESLIKRKIIIQDALSSAKSNYKDVKFEGKEFHKIKNNRQGLKECFNKIELELSQIKEELSFKTKLRQEIEFYLAHNKSLEGKEDLDKLQAKIKSLKLKYSNFTKDRTRIASLRVMASEFMEELDQLLKI